MRQRRQGRHEPPADHRRGPSLNFLSINKERLLIGTLGPISAPETVQAEVMRKSRGDERFRAAATVWRKLVPRWIEILSDDEAPELAAVVHRVTRQPMGERLKHPKDLGEMMVIAHAVVAAEAGAAVTVLIDDGPGHGSRHPRSGGCDGCAPKVAQWGRSAWRAR
jgi:hypothetical protein